MPVASKHRFAAGPAQPHAPMKVQAQPVEGLVDGRVEKTANDASSRRPMKTGMVTKKSGIAATGKVAVPPPVPRRTSRGKH